MRATRICAVVLFGLLVAGPLATLGGATATSKTVSSSKWVKAVCAAETKVRSATTSKFEALNAASKAGDASKTKAAFVALLDSLPGPTKTLLSSVKKAGVPKVTNGKKIAQAYVTAIQAIEKALPGVQKQAAALPLAKSAPAAP